MRTILITGATSATGQALIGKIADGFDTIYAHYRSAGESVKALGEAYGEKIIPLQADFAEEESTRNLIAQIEAKGTLPDAVVHLSAERASWNKFSKFTWDDYRRETDTGLRSAVLLSQAFVPPMTKKREGCVVFMLTAYLCGAEPKYMSPYIVSKYALYGLMKNLAAEYGGKGVRVHGVSPEMMDTPFVAAVPEAARRMAAENAASKKLLSPEIVAEAVAGLLSEERADLNGKNLYINADGVTVPKP